MEKEVETESVEKECSSEFSRYLSWSCEYVDRYDAVRLDEEQWSGSWSQLNCNTDLSMLTTSSGNSFSAQRMASRLVNVVAGADGSDDVKLIVAYLELLPGDGVTIVEIFSRMSLLPFLTELFSAHSMSFSSSSRKSVEYEFLCFLFDGYSSMHFSTFRLFIILVRLAIRFLLRSFNVLSAQLEGDILTTPVISLFTEEGLSREDGLHARTALD